MPSIDSVNLHNDYECIYLATFPRSGNHWMRGLVEKVTGIATGSVYCDPDPPHSPTLQPWGGYLIEGGYGGDCLPPQKKNVILLKTHHPHLQFNPFEEAKGKVVHIVRHPIDAIYSYYVWMCQYIWKTQPELILPQEILEEYLDEWVKFHSFYLNRDQTLVFRYEDLLKEPFKHLKNTLAFMGVNASDKRIRHAIYTLPPEGIPLKHVKHYRDEQIKLIFEKSMPLLKAYQYASSIKN